MMRLIPLFLLLPFLASCKKDPITDKDEPMAPSGYVPGEGVFIPCEGNYMFGNAKVSYYNFSSGTVIEDAFQSANSFPLGDVCQSISIVGSKGYIVVNNSGKIQMVNMENFQSSGSITGFNSPRYMLPVSSSKAYVTDLYANAVSIVDLNANQITGSIPCIGWTEQMFKIGDNVFVTNQTSGKLFVINALNDQLVDSLTLTKGANSILLDDQLKLWVMCSGESSSSTLGALYKIDPVSMAIDLTLPFPAGDSPWRLTTNQAKDTLFFLNHGINKMWVGNSTLPSSVFIPEGTKHFYGLGINPVNGDIYAADAIDYVQSGRVYRYNSAGVPVADFLVGIIPGDFFFY